MIDEEVRSIIIQNHEEAKRVIEQNRAALERIALALLEFEVLDAEEVEMIIRGEPIRRKKEPVEEAPTMPSQEDEVVPRIIKTEEGHATA